MTNFIRITQLDGKLPNIALMRLSAWHRHQGDAVRFMRTPYRHLDEPDYDIVYGSAIFEFSANRVDRLRKEFPNAIIGGTGTRKPDIIEDLDGFADCGMDYSIYPDFDASIGFTQRGCRLKCKFCVVPWKEGKPTHNSTIADIWRGEPYPKHLHLLDNDFFGGPEWRARIDEIRSGEFKVCFNQGINVRVMTDDVAAALATVDYRDDSFTRRRLYTAWDNLKDEQRFFGGVDLLESYGIPPKHLMAYMLVGFDPKETWERIMHRFERMKARGIMVYPMVYGDRPDLKRFQRWVLRRYHEFVPFEEYTTKSIKIVDPSQLGLGL